MRFLLAETFTASVAKLTNAEQKAVKVTAFDLQTDPRSPWLYVGSEGQASRSPMVLR